MKIRKPIKNPNESAFLGIGEGKRKAAKAEAEALLIKTQAEQTRLTLAAQSAAAAAGYKAPEQQAAESILNSATIEANSSNTLYYILGAIVIAVMVGLYFITKNRK